MPLLVYQRLVEVLKGRLWPTDIATIIRAEVEKRVNGILYDSENWPDRFKDHYQKEVEAGVKSGPDAEFKSSIEESAEVEARRRLRQLASAEWPRWLSANIEPRVAELEGKANENAFQLLKGPWPFTCDHCGTTSSNELTAVGVEELLRKGRVQIECTNPACEDRFLLPARRHRFRVALHDLIEAYIGA